MKQIIFSQGAKFIIVGVANTLVDLGVLNLLIFISGISAGPTYSLFKGASFSLAVINSYVFNKFWTFSASAQGYGGQRKKEFIQFFIVSLVGFGINVGVASLVVNVIGSQFGIADKLWANVGAMIATLIGMSWNFLGYKFIVFKK